MALPAWWHGAVTVASEHRPGLRGPHPPSKHGSKPQKQSLKGKRRHVRGKCIFVVVEKDKRNGLCLAGNSLRHAHV